MNGLAARAHQKARILQVDPYSEQPVRQLQHEALRRPSSCRTLSPRHLINRNQHVHLMNKQQHLNVDQQVDRGVFQAAPDPGQQLSQPPLTAPQRSIHIDWALLDNIPAWLRSLRLHKYTPCFTGPVPQSVMAKQQHLAHAARDDSHLRDRPPNSMDWTWRVMIALTDKDLESLGVQALGARRKMLRVFAQIQAELRRAPSVYGAR